MEPNLNIELNFDLGTIATQGLYLTKVTFTSLSEYLLKPAVPSCSQYHLITCSIELLPILNQLNSEIVVKKYREINSPAIVDIFLPFQEPVSRNIYQGRFIIHRGQLIAIRLCTQPDGCFSAWGRYKIDKIELPNLTQESQKVIIGEFSLRTKNARIGLLFSSELLSIGKQYANYCLDISIVTHNQSESSELAAFIDRIAQKTVMVQNRPLKKYDLITSDHLQQFSQGLLPEPPKNIIQIMYFSLDHIFATKGYLPTSKLAKIYETEVNVYFSQKEQSFMPFFQHPRFEMISEENMFDQSKKMARDRKKYIGKIMDLLRICNNAKIIWFLDKSLTSLCFLFALKRLTQHAPISKDRFNQFITIILVQNRQLQLLLQKLDLFHMDYIKTVQSSSYSCPQAMMLDQLSLAAEQHQQMLYPVIGSSFSLKLVLELLNRKEGEGGRRWLFCPFFSSQERIKIVLDKGFKDFVSSKEELRNAIRLENDQTRPSNSGAIHHINSLSNIDQLFQIVCLSSLPLNIFDRSIIKQNHMLQQSGQQHLKCIQKDTICPICNKNINQQKMNQLLHQQHQMYSIRDMPVFSPPILSEFVEKVYKQKQLEEETTLARSSLFK